MTTVMNNLKQKAIWIPGSSFEDRQMLGWFWWLSCSNTDLPEIAFPSDFCPCYWILPLFIFLGK